MKRALILGLLLFGMNAQAAIDNEKILEFKKKAIYYKIKAQVEANEITLKEAQALWQKELKKLKKEEGK